MKSKLRTLFFSLGLCVFLGFPTHVDPANLTNASAQLGNPRLSFIAGLSSLSYSTVTIDSSGNPDTKTTNLFTGDTVCITTSSLDNCKGGELSVGTVVSNTVFTTATVPEISVGTSDLVVASQSGRLTLTFTNPTRIPLNGSVLVTIPAVDQDGKTNDHFPDSSSTVGTNGFDLNGVSTSDVSIVGCTDSNWSIESVTAGTATTDHTILIRRTSTSCDSGNTITITIDSNPGLINPAPLTSHTAGSADIYTIGIRTRDTSDNKLDEILVKVAPIESTVVIGGNVGEGLSLAVSGITADSGNYCGVSRSATSPDTSSTAVPWGTLTLTDTFYNAPQLITISTNSPSGYTVQASENDQMGRDGFSCPGAADEANNCIPDTTCSSTACTESASSDWDDPTYHGLGFSLENVTGQAAAFSYNENSRSFSSRQLADQESSETPQSILTSNTSTVSHEAYLCYRLSVSSAQPAGTYRNNVVYTATANF